MRGMDFPNHLKVEGSHSSVERRPILTLHLRLLTVEAQGMKLDNCKSRDRDEAEHRAAGETVKPPGSGKFEFSVGSSELSSELGACGNCQDHGTLDRRNINSDASHLRLVNLTTDKGCCEGCNRR